MRKRISLRDHNQLPTQARKSGSKNEKKSYGHVISYLLIGSVVGMIVAKGYFSWMASRQVFTPFSTNTDTQFSSDMTRFWGTYRPQVYMGMKTKSARSLVTGLMWLKQHVRYHNDLPLRHTCEHGDKLSKYGWTAHDGVNFGMQDVVDAGYNLRTEFVKRSGGDHGGDWTWRISGRSSTAQPVTLSLIFYAATDGQGELVPVIEDSRDGARLVEIRGKTEELGSFTMKFPAENAGKKCRYNVVTAQASGLHKLKDAVLRKMHVIREGDKRNEKPFYFLGENSQKPDPVDAKSKVVFHQVTLELPFDIEIVFESGSYANRPNMLTGQLFTEKISYWKDKFDKKFESRFPLEARGYSRDHIDFAKSALSNMIGGIGHFYGHSLVQSEHQTAPVPGWDAHLLTAVPSRSFFPRGFLWDEGFHQLLISKWDRKLSMEIIQHWLELINIEGWIPREQILGDEARSKVPSEFVVQRNTNANPPTLFLAIESLMQGLRRTDDLPAADKRFLHKIYPRLQAWFDWFNTTQTGPVPFSYRWRGRDAVTDSELNPKTLTSGLDDYPRASHPSSDERHIDLRCWMALASGTMAKIAAIVQPDDAERYEETHRALTDPVIMNRLHWSAEMGVFSDFGNHTDRVALTRKLFQPAVAGQPPVSRVVRVARKKPQPRFVDAFGYVALFPFLLQQLAPDSPQLRQILADLRAEEVLWSRFGLRSLSARDPLYMKSNTEHDPPYWRGQVWINVNFLAVRALRHYADVAGPQRARAQELYGELRENLVRNVHAQYARTGYLWEQYNDATGKGQGTHPFTGWSALVVLIMSEQF